MVDYLGNNLMGRWTRPTASRSMPRSTSGGRRSLLHCQTGQAITYCRFSNPLVFVLQSLVQANIYLCIIGICLGKSDMSVGNSTTVSYLQYSGSFLFLGVTGGLKIF